MKFSQRIGETPESKEIQIHYIDDELKNRLWNTIEIYFVKPLYTNNKKYYSDKKVSFFNNVWHNFYKKPIHSQSNNPLFEIRDNFFYSIWYEIYDFIEFLLSTKIDVVNYEEFKGSLNSILKSEFSGYRVIDNLITQITNELEINEIKEAKSVSSNYPQLPGVDKHISLAIEKLSNRDNPDFRNSIKESISAVESTCRILTNESTLGKALSKLDSKGIVINTELKKGFEKIYNYTNSKESGIRHSIIDNNHIEPSFDEAKYMLVSCSAFINFILSKAKK
ncbi:AbiJ-NTD4 domain-containing protein [Tenacibaculum halocynthiae]|uniref:AbiJ-NTD4 domain-containing protein n=1 Tax=Tenacibaculum halocynthiae TaxID=1254437 RepID=UPI003D66049E